MQFFLCLMAVLCLIGPFFVMGVGGAQRVAAGPCEYDRIDGHAIVTAVKKAPADAYNCVDAVEVVFSFVPDDPSARGTYRFPHVPDTGLLFTLGAGINPPRKWAQRMGLVRDSIHRCIREEITRGACTPVVFTFPDLDLAGWEKACFDGSAL